MIAEIIDALIWALSPHPRWPATWCRVVAMHMRDMESGTGYRRTLVREEWRDD